MSIPNILLVLGTRPEAIKLAPVILALRKRSRQFRCTVVLTSQHRELASEVLELFGIIPDYDLNIMRAGQTPSSVTRAVLGKIGSVYEEVKPDRVIVQGDTTTAMASALEAFYRKIPVAHLEAGLRTDDRYYPFPEEINRRMITQLADMHFAATEGNRHQLLREGVPSNAVFVTGNPVIDALKIILRRFPRPNLPEVYNHRLRNTRIALLTTHRRENFGEGQKNIFTAVNELVSRHPHLHIVFPIHPNPEVQRAVRTHLRSSDRIHCVAPMNYATFIHALKQSDIVLSDSGGVQEEAPALGTPVVVLRNETERQEIIASGHGVLAGTDTQRIIELTEQLLTRTRKKTAAALPFGNGTAAEKIVRIVGGMTDGG